MLQSQIQMVVSTAMHHGSKHTRTYTSTNNILLLLADIWFYCPSTSIKTKWILLRLLLNYFSANGQSPAEPGRETRRLGKIPSKRCGLLAIYLTSQHITLWALLSKWVKSTPLHHSYEIYTILLPLQWQPRMFIYECVYIFI